jgi:dephospho-CoA kinase
MDSRKKLLIIGHARHGKDTMAEILKENLNYTFKSSSEQAAEIFIYNVLKEKYGYANFNECYLDRVSHRAEWYNLIKEYNKDDRAKLAKEILKRTDCYVGMREAEEINECKRQNLFDLIVWVDASKRLPLEPPESFNIDISLADIIIDNNTSLEDFRSKVIKLGQAIL